MYSTTALDFPDSLEARSGHDTDMAMEVKIVCWVKLPGKFLLS